MARTAVLAHHRDTSLLIRGFALLGIMVLALLLAHGQLAAAERAHDAHHGHNGA